MVDPIRYYTLPEVAQKFGVSQATVRRRIKEAKLSPYRPGRSMVLSEGDLIVLLDATRGRGPNRGP